MNEVWKTSRREISLSKPLVMAILNVTPDSFSDGGEFFTIERALHQAEKLISEGADVLDVGGESTRPNSRRISPEEEIKRVRPVVEQIAERFEIPISIDTSKAEVALEAVKAGAEIINDISGLRFDDNIVKVAAKHQTALVLMHLRGDFETMHRQATVADIFSEVRDGFRQSIEKAESFGVEKTRIALDVGIGFSKTFEQNLKLLAKLDKLVKEFSGFPFVVGTSRKSFIGKILNDAPADERLYGSLATNVVAVWNGAKILRVHDVKETVETLKVVEAIKNQL